MSNKFYGVVVGPITDARRVWRYQKDNENRKSKNRQHNVQEKKYKRTNNDVQNIHNKTKDRETRAPLKTRGEPRCCSFLVHDLSPGL
jgi:hypothetical protein